MESSTSVFNCNDPLKYLHLFTKEDKSTIVIFNREKFEAAKYFEKEDRKKLQEEVEPLISSSVRNTGKNSPLKSLFTTKGISQKFIDMFQDIVINYEPYSMFVYSIANEFAYLPNKIDSNNNTFIFDNCKTISFYITRNFIEMLTNLKNIFGSVASLSKADYRDRIYVILKILKNDETEDLADIIVEYAKYFSFCNFYLFLFNDEVVLFKGAGKQNFSIHTEETFEGLNNIVAETSRKHLNTLIELALAIHNYLRVDTIYYSFPNKPKTYKYFFSEPYLMTIRTAARKFNLIYLDKVEESTMVYNPFKTSLSIFSQEVKNGKNYANFDPLVLLLQNLKKFPESVDVNKNIGIFFGMLAQMKFEFSEKCGYYDDGLKDFCDLFANQKPTTQFERAIKMSTNSYHDYNVKNGWENTPDLYVKNFTWFKTVAYFIGQNNYGELWPNFDYSYDSVRNPVEIIHKKEIVNYSVGSKIYTFIWVIKVADKMKKLNKKTIVLNMKSYFQNRNEIIYYNCVSLLLDKKEIIYYKN